MKKDFPVSPPPPQTVCGRNMTADTIWYPRSEYQGKIVYFCTESCLEAFNADPDRFYTAHGAKKDGCKIN
jgi:YHS domain-containing protein